MARFGEFRACRANFVPLWPPTTRAGRTLYRIQGGCGASRHNRTPSAAGVKGAGGSGGPGCGARGRRLCLAWLRDTSCRRCGGRRIAWPRCRWVAAGPGRASRSTTPSRRRACGDLAGGPPPTGTYSGRARRRPEHQRRHEQHNNPAPHQRPGIQKTDIRIGCRPVVELGGFEPPTFSLRTRRATNCAIAPRTRTA